MEEVHLLLVIKLALIDTRFELHLLSVMVLFSHWIGLSSYHLPVCVSLSLQVSTDRPVAKPLG